ncbi:MAG: hypothetical protein QME75_16205 [Deltaproteobacteria bacterium]|nr:hypothetical protein [Deltaproteobacteria bacterium]MDI6880865.1 hypothetical protein [Desulfitobacteriaceae bacterium]
MLGARLHKANHIARRLWRIYFPDADWREHLTKHGVYAVCVGSYRKVRRPCSCWMCGNPRRYWGARTRQEIAAALRQREQELM